MKTYKAELTIPTEQYGNIRPTVEGTALDIVDAYREFKGLLKEGGGITPKEFNAALDRYLTDGTGETDVYVRMNASQKACFQEVKKAFARLENKK